MSPLAPSSPAAPHGYIDRYEPESEEEAEKQPSSSDDEEAKGVCSVKAVMKVNN